MRSADGVAGGREGARDFPGANRMLLNGTGPQITTNRMTVSAWAHPDAGTSNVNIVGRWNGALATNSWLLNCCPVEAGIGDAGGQDVATGVLSYPKGGPLLHHYCFTKGPSTLECWIDGKRDAAVASTRTPQNSGTPCIGDAALAIPFNGTIKHVAVWDEQLTPWEVMQLAQGVAPWDVRGAKLRVWIPLTEWAGGTGDARDLSTLNQTATPAGGTTYAPRPASSAVPINPLEILKSQLFPGPMLPFLHTSVVVSG